MKTPLYTATVRLQIDRDVAKIIQTEGVTPLEDYRLRLHANAIRTSQSRNIAETRRLRAHAW